MRILLTGKNGQVGYELQRSLAPFGEVVALDVEDLDLVNTNRIRDVVRKLRPGLIVNAAAYTTVDQAEQEPDLAMLVNGIAPGILAEEATRLQAAMIHYSTDYIFDGMKSQPYREDDSPHPLNVYGKTKLAGEKAVQVAGGRFIILRTSWVYGARGRNFFLTMLKLARERKVIRVVDDQVGCPTWCRSIGDATATILSATLAKTAQKAWDAMEHVCGIYHFCASGSTSWHGFARAILNGDPQREQHVVRQLLPIPSIEYETAAERPKYSVLDTHKFASTFAIEPSSWQLQLQACWRTVGHR